MDQSMFDPRLLELSAIVGTLFPLAAALFKQSGFSRRLNTIICVVLAVIAGVITCWQQDRLDPHDIIGSILALYAAAQVFYQGLWQHIGEPSLTHLTSIYKDGAVEQADPANDLSPAPPNPLH